MNEENDSIIGWVTTEKEENVLLCEFTQDIDHPVDPDEVRRLFLAEDEHYRATMRPALEIYAGGDEKIGWAVLPRWYLLDVGGYPVVAWRLL